MKIDKHMSTRIPYKLNIEYQDPEDLVSAIREKDFVDLVHDETLECIKHAIENKESKALLFEVNETGIYLIIEKDLFEDSLDSVLKYYEKTEQYEKCIEANNLIQSLK